MKLSTIVEWTQARHLLKTLGQLPPAQLKRAVQAAVAETDKLGNGPEYYEHLEELKQISQALKNHPQRRVVDDEILMIDTLTQGLPRGAA